MINNNIKDYVRMGLMFVIAVPVSFAWGFAEKGFSLMFTKIFKKKSR